MSKKEELAKYAGEEHFMKAKKLSFYDVGINGDTGDFEKNYKVKEKWEKEVLGRELEVVFLRVRRKLGAWDDSTQEMYGSTEHNSSRDIVSLYKGKKKLDTGVSFDLREKYQMLKVIELVYSLYDNKELIRVSVKGSSFGEPTDTTKKGFFDYLASFDRSKDEHIWEYKTIITPEKRLKGKREYYAMTFKRGEKLEEPMLLVVEKNLKDLYDAFNFTSTPRVFKEKSNDGVDESSKELPTVDLDENDIKAEDIPF